MNINQISNYSKFKENTLSNKDDAIDNYSRSVDRDLISLFLFTQGRVRFGNGANSIGENIAGQFVTFTTSATPDAENTVTHKVGAIPVGYIITKQNKAGSLYTGTTSWTSSNLYLKCNIASVTYTIFLLK